MAIVKGMATVGSGPKKAYWASEAAVSDATTLVDTTPAGSAAAGLTQRDLSGKMVQHETSRREWVRRTKLYGGGLGDMR
jgi:hypothetical protein